MYAKYYFELRALFKDNEKEFPLKPLDKMDAVNLELNSNKYKNNLIAETKSRMGATDGHVPPPKKEWVC